MVQAGSAMCLVHTWSSAAGIHLGTGKAVVDSVHGERAGVKSRELLWGFTVHHSSVQAQCFGNAQQARNVWGQWFIQACLNEGLGTGKKVGSKRH